MPSGSAVPFILVYSLQICQCGIYSIPRIDVVEMAVTVTAKTSVDCCRVRKQVVNIPSFIVRLDSQKHIDFSLKSPYGGGRPGWWLHFVIKN